MIFTKTPDVELPSTELLNYEEDFQTPAEVCDYMAGLLPSTVNTVLEPTPGQGNLVRSLANFKVTAPEDFWKVSGRFDAVVMNPPFSPMMLGYKILYQTMEMSDIIIALMPWLVIINSDKRTNDILKFGLKSITHLPRSTFKNARVQTCILELNKNIVTDKTEILFLELSKNKH